MALDVSPLVRRFATRIAVTAATMPIVDVGCGSGRNALPLAQLGCSVLCLDKDLSRFAVQSEELALRIVCKKIDLVNESWPFGAGRLGGILNIHLFLPNLFPFFECSLASGKYLLFETPPGNGGNYLELPMAGDVRRALANGFKLEFFKESVAGPRNYGAVTTKILAKRR